MKPQLERIEVESLRRRDDDFSIDHAVVRKVRQERFTKLGKAAVERSKVAALNEEVGPLAEHNRARAVPLRLVQKSAAFRQYVGEFCQHGLDRWRDGERRRRTVRLIHGSGCCNGLAGLVVLSSKTGLLP